MVGQSAHKGSLTAGDRDASMTGEQRAMHSPAPWFVRVHQNWTDVDCKHWTVAGDVSNEDARLIAAAPDMLLALDDAYRAICHIKFDRDKEPALAAAKDRARAAIAKATGAA